MEATRYAARILRDHCKEGRFSVWFPTLDDCKIMADRFERLGCATEINGGKGTVVVECPPNLDLASVDQVIESNKSSGAE